MLGLKKFWARKNSGSKKILGPKKFESIELWDEKNVGPKQFQVKRKDFGCVKKNLVIENLQISKNFGFKEIFVQKYL